MDKTTQIIDAMLKRDAFSQWLNVRRIAEKEGYCQLEMVIRKEMLNGFGMAHGAVCYALADSALAFASNSHGRKAVSIETSISHTIALQEGAVITATATLDHLSNKIGIYTVTVKNQEQKTVALFKGTVYRTEEEWLVETD